MEWKCDVEMKLAFVVVVVDVVIVRWMLGVVFIQREEAGIFIPEQ